MNELIKNIGLGLFVNGSFALLNGVFTLQSFLITILSVGIMWFCIKREKKEQIMAGQNLILAITIILFAYVVYKDYKDKKEKTQH